MYEILMMNDSKEVLVNNYGYTEEEAQDFWDRNREEFTSRVFQFMTDELLEIANRETRKGK